MAGTHLGRLHMLNSTLVLRQNGSGPFDANLLTHTHGTDVWHSTKRLLAQAANWVTAADMIAQELDTPKMGLLIRSTGTTSSASTGVTYSSSTRLRNAAFVEGTHYRM